MTFWLVINYEILKISLYYSYTICKTSLSEPCVQWINLGTFLPLFRRCFMLSVLNLPPD